MEDGFNLARFVTAQDQGGIYDRVVAELRNGRKVSHWMWYVFPQISGLGSSPMARTFAISSLAEARAYLQHPVLAARLVECAGIVVATEDADAEDIFGWIDAMKLRSSMTLFARAAPDEPVFGQILARFFKGIADPETDRRLAEIGS
jgi:uncharacterized protein (DUF1810 family)